jgi:hypothetical protein
VTLYGSRSFAEKAASRFLRRHRVREGSVGEGVSPALDATATEARADLTVKAESKRCFSCSQAVVVQQLLLLAPAALLIVIATFGDATGLAVKAATVP